MILAVVYVYGREWVQPIFAGHTAARVATQELLRKFLDDPQLLVQWEMNLEGDYRASNLWPGVTARLLTGVEFGEWKIVS